MCSKAGSSTLQCTCVALQCAGCTGKLLKGQLGPGKTQQGVGTGHLPSQCAQWLQLVSAQRSAAMKSQCRARRRGQMGQSLGDRGKLAVGQCQQPDLGIGQLGQICDRPARTHPVDRPLCTVRCARQHRLQLKYTRALEQAPERLADPARTNQVKACHGQLN
jgi:hypothetical protein